LPLSNGSPTEDATKTPTEMSNTSTVVGSQDLEDDSHASMGGSVGLTWTQDDEDNETLVEQGLALDTPKNGPVVPNVNTRHAKVAAWDGVSSNGIGEDGLPMFVAPGHQWTKNAIQSHVLIMNLVNKFLANEICPKIMKRSKPSSQDLEFRTDAALLFIAAGLYDPTVKGLDPEVMAPSVAVWMPNHFKHGCIKYAASAYEFLTSPIFHDFDGVELPLAENVKCRFNTIRSFNYVEGKWLIQLCDRIHNMNKFRIENSNMDDGLTAGELCIALWRKPGAIETLSSIREKIREQNKGYGSQNNTLPVAKAISSSTKNERKHNPFSFKKETIDRDNFTVEEYATLHHFLYVAEVQDGKQPAYIGTKTTTKATISVNSFRTLKPRIWLNDSVMDVYFHFCRTESEGRVEFLPSQFMQCLLHFSENNKPVYQYEDASRHFSYRFDHKSAEHNIRGIFEEKTVVVAINKDKNHWTGAVIFPQQKRITYYDSFHASGKQYVNAIYRFLRDEWERRQLGGTLEASGKWNLEYQTPTTYPKQVGTWECGVFVCCLYDSFLEPALPLPDGLQNCFVRRNLIALRIIRHCLGPKSEKQFEEEKRIQELRRERKNQEKKP
jgi:Ulp1 protease family, C-terminal catalytic domain